MKWMLLATATSMSCTKLWESWPFSINSCGRSDPIPRKNDFKNHKWAIPCLVHPESDTLQVLHCGAFSVWKDCWDLVVLPFTTKCWGKLIPCALTAAARHSPISRNTLANLFVSHRMYCRSVELVVNTNVMFCPQLIPSELTVYKVNRKSKYWTVCRQPILAWSVVHNQHWWKMCPCRVCITCQNYYG